ncbi:MAG: glycosyltransferase family 39 protein [Ardenticatenaceae bacterium]|nr:glycosyltransferase family 39 protein [Ardenticatenaceae bacterium]
MHQQQTKKRTWVLEGSQIPSLLLFLLFLVALLPRLTAVSRYITPDELMWVHRSVVFREALLNGRFADTITTGHPGVITTWLGALGISIQLLFDTAARANYVWISHVAWMTPDNMAAFQKMAALLTAARLAVIVANSAGLVAIFQLARRLWGAGVALLLALLLAFDPFVAGLSGLLHVDALMTILSTLALLTFILFLSPHTPHPTPHTPRTYLVASAILSALAVLAKSPAILLPPLVALLLGVRLLAQRGEGWGKGVATAVRDGLLWLFTYLVTLLLVLPALWADPVRVWGEISGSASRHVETALRPTYFMGNVTFDHGWSFYPVALVFRLGPLVLIGLLLFVGLWFWQRKWHWSLLVLGVWTVLYWVGISLTAKKFDRYALPLIFPLTAFAALGWWWLGEKLPRRRSWLFTLLIAAQLAYLLPSLPFPLSAYNPLLGGATAAERVLTVGWGEAISVAGSWLAAQPGVGEQTAVSGFPTNLAPFFPGQTLLPGSDGEEQADYIIRTVNTLQLENGRSWQPPGSVELIHTIRFGGREQGWIYRQLDPVRRETAVTSFADPLSFANRVQLFGARARATPQELLLDVVWRLAAGAENGRYIVKLVVRDENNFVWRQQEDELVNANYFYPEYWSPSEPTQVTYRLDLPGGMPPGNYRLEMTLFDALTNARLPLLAADGAFQGVFYTASDIVVSDSQINSYSELGIQYNQQINPLPLHLVGQEPLPASLFSGQMLPLDLLWQVEGTLPADLQVKLGLGETTAVSLPISRFASQQWMAGMRLHEKYGLPLPPQLAGGVYPVWVQVQTAVNEPIGDPIPLGELEVKATDRLFTLPGDIATPLVLDFGGVLALRGVTVGQTAVSSGGSVDVALVWQVARRETAVYTAFVHLVDGSDNIVAQVDQWPGGLPSDTRAEGEVIIDRYTLALPPDLPTGSYRLVVGLYTASDGVRLPISAAADTNFADNRALLPVVIEVEK